MGEIHLDFTRGKLQDLRFPVGPPVNHLLIAPGLSVVAAFAHHDAVIGVIFAEMVFRPEGRDHHQLPVLQYQCVRVGIGTLIRLPIDGDRRRLEHLFHRLPVFQVGAAGVKDVRAHGVVVPEQDVLAVRQLFDAGIVGRRHRQRRRCHLRIAPEVQLQAAGTLVPFMGVDGFIGRIEPAERRDIHARRRFRILSGIGRAGGGIRIPARSAGGGG